MMPKRLIAAVALILLGVTLSGCTKCGWIWNDRPGACRDDAPVR